MFTSSGELLVAGAGGVLLRSQDGSDFTLAKTGTGGYVTAMAQCENGTVLTAGSNGVKVLP
jgi:hypothetical protein